MASQLPQNRKRQHDGYSQSKNVKYKRQRMQKFEAMGPEAVLIETRRMADNNAISLAVRGLKKTADYREASDENKALMVEKTREFTREMSVLTSPSLLARCGVN